MLTCAIPMTSCGQRARTCKGIGKKKGGRDAADTAAAAATPPTTTTPITTAAAAAATSSGRRQVRNQGKAGVFRKWLLDKFGADLLQSGTGVLDVAGGKGELAWELAALNNIDSTIVDPRPLQLQSFKARLAKGMYHRNPLLSQHNTHGFDDGDGENAAAKEPRHLRCFLDSRSLHLLHGCSGCDQGGGGGGGGRDGEWAAHFRDSLLSAVSTVWTKKGLCHESDATSECCYHSKQQQEEEEKETETEPESFARIYTRAGPESPVATPANSAFAAGDSNQHVLDDPVEAKRLLMGSSVIVGLHPDQATEPIVDHAIALGTPFAIIPCCVYASEFPKRHLKATPAARVTSYEDFLTYLCEKHPKIATEVMPFEGKNTLLWWPGPS